MFRERRKDRSKKVYDAVRKQLVAVARDGCFPNALIADDEGLVIAANNNDPINESLGVLGIEFFSRREVSGSAQDKTYILRRKDNQHSIIVHGFTVLGQQVFFLALSRDPVSVTPLITRAVSGAIRILED